MYLDGDVGLATLVDDLEGEVLDIILDRLVLELLSDETFLFCSQYLGIGAAGLRRAYDIEDGAFGVAGELILGGVSNKTLVVGEGYP